MLHTRSAHPTLAHTNSRLADSSHFRLEVLHDDTAARAGLQDFISEHFRQAYDARVSHFGQTLMGCRNPQGEWIAALALTSADSGKLFLENYLDRPIEEEVSQLTHQTVSRDQIVEVGNLAALHPGSARLLIAHTARHLNQMGFRWVCFTATMGLLNSFVKLQLQPVVIAQANPERLPAGGANWGSYYETRPQVMVGDIGTGHAKLSR
jgi:hypothetical protein